MRRRFNPQVATGGSAAGFCRWQPAAVHCPPTVDKKELSLGYSNVANSYAWEAQASFDDYDGFDDLRADRSAVANAIERFEFAPSAPAAIRGDGTSERIFIESFDLDGELSYLLLPEYSDEAYQLVNSGGGLLQDLSPGVCKSSRGACTAGRIPCSCRHRVTPYTFHWGRTLEFAPTVNESWTDAPARCLEVHARPHSRSKSR